MVSDPIPDLDEWVCSVWPLSGCLSIWPRNLIGHKKDVVSTLGVFVTSHIEYERKFLTLYKYEFLST